MTDIEQKALALVNKIFAEVSGSPIDYDALVGAGDVVTLALCRAIERHEAFRQEMSDAVDAYIEDQPHIWKQSASGYFSRFIIPKPKPDPLVEVLHEVDTGPEWDSPEDYCNKIRAALEARGLEIREKD